MANELMIHYPTGSTLYALLFDATGNIWNGSSFAAPGSASWTDYDIAMTEVATATGIYRGTMPAAAAGVYSFVVRKQAGASPAVSDITVGTGEVRWTGTAEETVPASANVTTVKGVDASTALGTAQTGDAYAIVNHATYGNAQLARTGADSDTLETLSDQLDLVSGGARTYSYANTVDDGSGNLLDGVFVELSTDAGKTNIVYTTHTNSIGAFAVYNDTAGTHYLWLQLAGYTFTQGAAVTLA